MFRLNWPQRVHLCVCVCVCYPRLQVLPERLCAGPVPPAQRHLDLTQENIPGQGLRVPHGQVEGATIQLVLPYFVLVPQNK